MTASLDRLAGQARTRGAAPVESWNPPYCGDIGLSIAHDGSWSYQGSPIGRRALVDLFASVLRKDEDGSTYLVTPAEKVLVHVADAPFLAVEMAVSGDGSAQTLSFRTNLDEWVDAGPDHPLRFEVQPDGSVKPYVRVRGRLDARIARSIFLDLVALARPSDPGMLAASGADAESAALGIWSGGIWWPLAGTGASLSLP